MLLLDSLVLCRNGKRIDLHFRVVFPTGQIKLLPQNVRSVPRCNQESTRLASNHKRSLFPRAVLPSSSASSSVPPVASFSSRELVGDGLRMSVCQRLIAAGFSSVAVADVVDSPILVVRSTDGGDTRCINQFTTLDHLHSLKSSLSPRRVSA